MLNTKIPLVTSWCNVSVLLYSYNTASNIYKIYSRYWFTNRIFFNDHYFKEQSQVSYYTVNTINYIPNGGAALLR